MTQNPHILAIDIGNTTTKIALSGDQSPRQPWRVETQQLESELSQILSQLSSRLSLAVGWISTARPFPVEKFAAWQHFEEMPRFFPITSTSDLPINNLYSTPHTLGTDRIVGVIAACSYSPGRPVLVIDAGTAITFDFADAAGNYLGGGISPGVRMRFRALNAFTARLPLVEAQTTPPLVGDSTENSIRSGVINGCIAEVKGIIDRYRERYGTDLQVFLIGGDQYLFENQLKNVNFAASNLVLEGIQQCIQHQIST